MQENIYSSLMPFYILWSDETKIELFDRKGVNFVWRKPGEEYNELCTLPAVIHGGRSIMVWGWFASLYRAQEICILWKATWALMYQDILKTHMLPSATRLIGGEFWFQHDNEPKRSAKSTKAFLRKSTFSTGLLNNSTWNVVGRIENRSVAKTF